MFIYVKKLVGSAMIPARANKTDAGYDLWSVESYTLKPLERKLFKTGIAIEIPSGYYGRVAPRSGLAFKRGLDVMAGVIDSGFRGEVGVILINLSNEEVYLTHGDRIAQLIIETCHQPAMIQVEELNDSSRAEKGFGSSGK
jgi:dUTP pyrophosphatase